MDTLECTSWHPKTIPIGKTCSDTLLSYHWTCRLRYQTFISVPASLSIAQVGTLLFICPWWNINLAFWHMKGLLFFQVKKKYRNFPILRTLVELQHIFSLVNNFLPNFFNSSKHGRGFRLAIQIIKRDGFGLLGQFFFKKPCCPKLGQLFLTSDTTYISCSLSRFKFPMPNFGQLYCF